MAFAPPVSRGDFYYHDGLYVDVGNLNRHKRATAEEIRALLRPDLKKSKNASVLPPKDQVGHWYEAQLIHYGLPPSKDKARAKMRLLEALNSSRLVVPPNIAQMEAAMKKEYAAAERKAKAEIKGSLMLTREGGSPALGKKRKQAEPSVDISFGNQYDGLSDIMNAANSQSQTKKARKGQSDSTKQKTDKTASLKPSKKTSQSKPGQSLSQGEGVRERAKQTARKGPIQTARSTKLHAAWLEDPSRGPGPINPVTGVRYAHPSEMSMEAAEVAARIPMTQGKSRREQELDIKKERAQKELSVKKEPKLKKEPGVKLEPSTRPSSQLSPSLGLINGIYDLSCPTVEDNWDSTDLTMTLALDGTTVWGAYDLGMFSGILSLPDRPWQASSEPLPFIWRGREDGEGEMSFGDGCEGEISFLGNGVVEGWISVYGRCCFRGRRRHEAGTSVRPARSMRAEWDDYNEEAYEEERVGRWG